MALMLLLGSAMPVPSAMAQSVTIPDSLVTSSSPLSQESRTTVREYVAQWAPGLSSEDPAQIAQSRTRLLAPLEIDGVGVPFRLEYGNEVCTAAEPLLSSQDELVVINALRLLGEVATDRSAAAVERALGSSPGNGPALPGVRYTAVYALVRTFEAVAGESPAVAPDRIRTLLGRIGQVIREDEDPWILDVAVRAMLAAGTIDKQNYEGIRADALSEMARAVSDRVRAMDDAVGGEDRLYFIVRATVAMRDALTDRRSLPAPAAQASAAMGGDILAFVAGRVATEPEHPSEERRLLSQMVNASQAVVYFSARAINPSANPDTPPSLGPLISPAEASQRPQDREFLRLAPAEIRKLGDAPYSFPAGRFDRP